MSQTEKVFEFNNRKITLIGTAHVSSESINEVKNVITEKKPDCVCVELDEKRAESIENKEKFSQIDIVKIIKNNQGFLMLANLILSSFQRRMGENVGVKPGDEMLCAMETAKQLSIPCEMVDRPIQTTLKRAWTKNSFWGKCKLLAVLLTSAFSKEEVSEEEIESLKNNNELGSMMDSLSKELPVIKQVLIDERDQYLASKIWESKGSNVVAVLGAGHLPGVSAYLEKLAKNEASSDVTEIASLPKKGVGGKIIGWLIPVIIIGFIAAGFIYGGAKAGKAMLSTWILWNGIPSAVLSIFALAHPLTVLISFIAAPFTSLCPFVGVGFVTAIVQAIVCKPKVKDMENLQDDVNSLKGFYKNRILRVLLVLIFSTIGSMIGTFAGGADVIKTFSQIQ